MATKKHIRAIQRHTAKRIEMGKCAQCNSKRMLGLTLCRAHRDAGRARVKAHRELIRDLGLCLGCRQEVAGGYIRCGPCYDAINAYQRARARRIGWYPAPAKRFWKHPSFGPE